MTVITAMVVFIYATWHEYARHAQARCVIRVIVVITPRELFNVRQTPNYVVASVVRHVKRYVMLHTFTPHTANVTMREEKSEMAKARVCATC